MATNSTSEVRPGARWLQGRCRRPAHDL